MAVGEGRLDTLIAKDKKKKMMMMMSVDGDYWIDFGIIVEATNSFAQDNKISGDCFSTIYRGVIQHEDVTITRMPIHHPWNGEYNRFLPEVQLFCQHAHPNIGSLKGACMMMYEGYLAFDFRSIGSLSKVLGDIIGGTNLVDWARRLKIALGIAEGLSYLHNVVGVIYLNLEPRNILITDDYTAKLTDLRNAIHIPPDGIGLQLDGGTFIRTLGYMEPHLAYSLAVSTKTDIYNLGMVLLQLATGKRAIDRAGGFGAKTNLVGWVSSKQNNLEERVDSRLPLSIHGSARRVLRIAMQCVDKSPQRRPAIDSVLFSLRQEFEEIDILSFNGDTRIGNRQMGGCASMDEDQGIVIFLKIPFTSETDKLVNPSAVKDKSVLSFDRPIARKPTEPVTSFHDLETDCEDDFFGVKGDFTPSCGGTPIPHGISRGAPRINVAPGNEKTSSPTDWMKKLLELFRKCVGCDQDHQSIIGSNQNGATAGKLEAVGAAIGPRTSDGTRLRIHPLG